jgi:DNA helicase II / ATP-dependent DNA helicase PcrA
MVRSMTNTPLIPSIIKCYSHALPKHPIGIDGDMLKYTPAQILAINTLDKNLQIIACAGSGKTQVISQRIINLLKDNPDIRPTHITAFTYTEKAAGELKGRILKLCRDQLGSILGLAEMYVGTIHSWCLRVLQEHIYEYEKFSVLDEVTQKLFIDRNFSRIGMKELDMERFKDTGLFIGLMGILRESEMMDGSKVPDNLKLALQKYEETLHNAAYFDFTAIMKRALSHLQTDVKFQEKISNQLKYLIVDEYQDVNPIQEAMVSEIYKLGANVCVVGDDDQTIFQWRGSDVSYIQTFQKRYKGVEYIKLEDNFRSTTAVVDVALKTITNNVNRLPKQMKASGEQNFERGDVLINFFDSVEDENAYIVRTIQNLRGTKFTDKDQTRGLDYSDFVILLRKWKKAKAVVDALQEADIPFIVSGVNQLFEREEVKAAVAIFQYQKRDIDRSVLESYWRGVMPNLEAEKLEEALQYLDEKKPEDFSFYASYSLQEVFLEFLGKLGVKEELFAEVGAGGPAHHSTEEIVFYNLGMFSQVLDDFEAINYVSEPKTKLLSFLDFIRYAAQDYYPEGWLSNTYQTPNAVQVMTIFQAKGLEFPVVFLPGMNRNYLPSQKHGGRSIWHFLDKSLIKGQSRYEGGIEDERRLLYVAVTRSQKFLFISRAPDGRNEQKESMFCKELQRSDYIFSSKTRDFSDREKTSPQPKTIKADIQLNFSILKNFFDCPYRFKLMTLYGFCQPLSPRLGYGKSIHDCLMEVHKEALDGADMNRTHVPRLLDIHLHLPYALDTVRADMRDRASTALDEYFDLNEAAFKDILFAEKEIALDLGGGILVNGRMDLIKRKQLDGSYITTIVDFKSDADAQTYDVSMDQLSLYALGYKDLSGERADFLEIYNLDENRPFRQELLDSSLEDTRHKIIEAADAIRENRLERTCEAKVCQTCRLNMICSGAVVQIQR